MPPESLVVLSKDGVPISVEKRGAGPALLLVHGAGLDAATSWALVFDKLSRHFTVYAINRRGRKPSGDAPAYSLQAEADDLAAVAERIREPLTLLGHSYGGIVVLTALPQLSNVARLILYEPPIFERPRGPEFENGLRAMEEALAAGRREEAAVMFVRNQVGAPADQLAQLRASPVWPKFIEVAPTLLRESRVVNSLPVSRFQLAAVNVPAVMLVGDITPPDLRARAIAVCQSIPRCRMVILEGQGHGAMLAAPDLFVSKILEIADLAAARS